MTGFFFFFLLVSAWLGRLCIDNLVLRFFFFQFLLGFVVCVMQVTFVDGSSFGSVAIKLMFPKHLLTLEIIASNLFLSKNAEGGDCWIFEAQNMLF